jgi:DNA polymerase III subunit delta
MRALEWLRDRSTHPLKPVYAVHGDDLYLRRQSIDAISLAALQDQADEMAISRFEGKAASLADVLDELRMLPFFSKRRIVIVDDGDPFVTKYRKDLEGYIASPSGTGVLILVLKSWPSNTKLYKLVETAGLAIDCSSPGEKDLVPWLTHLAASKYQSHLEPDAARLLVELVGAEVGILASETEKLAVYVGAAGKIRREDVAKLVEAGRIETVWKVLDAATTGEAATAVKHLDDLLASGEHPIRVLAGFTSSLLKTYHAGRLRAARVNLEEACRIAGVFTIEKTRRQHAHLGPSRVDRLPAMLAKADLDLKGGSLLDPRVVLEQLLVELALPRTD